MVERIEEPDIFAGLAHLPGQALQRARLAGEIRAVVDHGNPFRGGGKVLDPVLLE